MDLSATAIAPAVTVLMPWRKEVALLLLLGLLFSIGFLLMAVKLARAVRANELAYIEIEKQAEDLQIANKSLNVLSITDKCGGPGRLDSHRAGIS